MGTAAVKATDLVAAAARAQRLADLLRVNYAVIHYPFTGETCLAHEALLTDYERPRVVLVARPRPRPWWSRLLFGG